MKRSLEETSIPPLLPNYDSDDSSDSDEEDEVTDAITDAILGPNESLVTKTLVEVGLLRHLSGNRKVFFFCLFM